MADPVFITNFHHLLKRYHAATKKLVAATPKEMTLGDGLPFTGGIDSFEGRAMERLLIRQGGLLLHLFNSLTTGNGLVDDTTCTRIRRRLKDIELASYNRLYAYPPDKVPSYWRQIYSDAQILTTFYAIIEIFRVWEWGARQQALIHALDDVVARLDRSLIVAGGGHILNRDWILKTIEAIDGILRPSSELDLEREFSTQEPLGRPTVTRPCERCQGWDIIQFESYMTRGLTRSWEFDEIGPLPVVFTDLTKDSWPALSERKWVRPDYLFRETLGGRRLVPVEIGYSYADESWGQELMTFKEYVVRYIDKTLADDDAAPGASDKVVNASAEEGYPAPPGYLAQHELFNQIPSLRADILVPDFCWATVPRLGNATKLEVPHINAWFGPAGASSPLHTDSHHNLLCQVVGTKFVRLYPPQADKYMRQRPAIPGGVDMSNTSYLDLGAIEGWDSGMADDEDALAYIQEVKDSLEDVEYFECILEPGDTLLIPAKWWHYVRSLSVSFSVSFWWD